MPWASPRRVPGKLAGSETTTTLSGPSCSTSDLWFNACVLTCWASHSSLIPVAGCTSWAGLVH